MSGTSSKRDKPWLFRTYAGHSTATASNELYRRNLAKGQTGLSVAFDLPTQTGYDSDHPLARGEVGKVGVPISHLGDMRSLFAGIPLDAMNTSMTINATAAWLLALYVGAGRGAGRRHDQAYRHGAERHPEGVSLARDLHLPAGAVAAADQGRDRLHRRARCRNGTRPMSAPTICRRRERRRRRSWPSRSPPPRRCSTRSEARAKCPRSISRTWSAASRSSSMPACASSPRSPRCAPSSICGTRSPRRAMA